MSPDGRARRSHDRITEGACSDGRVNLLRQRIQCACDAIQGHLNATKKKETSTGWFRSTDLWVAYGNSRSPVWCHYGPTTLPLRHGAVRANLVILASYAQIFQIEQISRHCGVQLIFGVSNDNYEFYLWLEFPLRCRAICHAMGVVEATLKLSCACPTGGGLEQARYPQRIVEYKANRE